MGEGLSRARSNWRHAVAVTLPIIGESNKINIHCPVLRLEFRIKLEFVTVLFKSKLTLHFRSSHE